MANYLYNGVELPDINEVWTDKVTYPYAALTIMQEGDLYAADLYLSTVPYTYDDTTGDQRLNYEGTFQYKYFRVTNTEDALLVGGQALNVWNLIMENTTSNGHIIYAPLLWTNHDILNTDGSVYLAASDPVPVGGETTDLKPVYKQVNGSFVKQTAYERQNGEWVLISSAESTDSENVLYDGTVTLDENGNASLEKLLPLELGTTYKVEYDGVLYESAYRTVDVTGIGFDILGNAPIIVTPSEDTGEPFCIMQSGTYTALLTKDSGVHTLKIYTDE